MMHGLLLFCSLLLVIGLLDFHLVVHPIAELYARRTSIDHSKGE